MIRMAFDCDFCPLRDCVGHLSLHLEADREPPEGEKVYRRLDFCAGCARGLWDAYAQRMTDEEAREWLKRQLVLHLGTWSVGAICELAANGLISEARQGGDGRDGSDDEEAFT